MYQNDFISLCKQIGFNDPRVVAREEISLKDSVFRPILGDARFFSTTYRLFKLKSLEDNCENYGQFAIYQGNMEGNAQSYTLDKNNLFPRHKPVPVSGNTASILSESWLNKYFKVIGEKKSHFGPFLYNEPKTFMPIANIGASAVGGCGCGSQSVKSSCNSAPSDLHYQNLKCFH